MPAYQFYRLSDGLAESQASEVVLYNDAAAITQAMAAAFPEGCDVWQATRFVGRFHRAVEPQGAPTE